MKNKFKISISILLIISIVLSLFVSATAAETPSTVPNTETKTYTEYYNLKDGIYTKKSVQNNNDGTYDITLDTYTSNVSLVSAKNKKLDILFLIDTSGSMTFGWNDHQFIALPSKQRIGIIKSNLLKLQEQLSQSDTSINKINVALYTFHGGGKYSTEEGSGGLLKYKIENQCQNADKQGFVNLSSDNFTDGINDITAVGAAGIGTGTPTYAALSKAEDIMNDRPNDNKKIVILITDGLPGQPTNDNLNTNDTLDYDKSGRAISATMNAANKLKSTGVSLYVAIAHYEANNSLLLNNGLKEDGLNQIITSGYYTESGANSGTKLRLRSVYALFNVVSSNFNLKDEYSNKKFNISDSEENADISFEKRDNDTAKDADPNYTYWMNGNGWQQLPEWYERNSNDINYMIDISDVSTFDKNMENTLRNELKVTYVCQGSLLEDYSVKDTVSDYFTVVKGSTQVYSVGYAATKNGDTWVDAYKGDAQANNNDYTHGAASRVFKNEVNITDKVSSKIIETDNYVELQTDSSFSSIIDSCVVDDIVNPSNESHSGNMLRIKFKIQPKDSFLGGHSVPTNIPEDSGIYDVKNKCYAQHFDDCQGINTDGTDKLNSASPKISVSLSDCTAVINPDNVKIGLIYNKSDLGDNVVLQYKGRQTDTYYLYDGENVYKDSINNENIIQYSSSTTDNSTPSCPDDYVLLYTSDNATTNSTTLDIIKTESQVQFNTTGITKNGNEYNQQNITGNKNIYLIAETQTEKADTIVNRLRQVEDGTDDSATINEGVLNSKYYKKGYVHGIRLNSDFDINVYVPVITAHDVLRTDTSTKWPTSADDISDALSASLVKYSTTTVDYNIDGVPENKLVYISVDNDKKTVLNEATPLEVNEDGDILSGTIFVNDANNITNVFTNSGKISGYFDADNDENISEGDFLKYKLYYENFSPSSAFKSEINEFWSENTCSICDASESLKTDLGGFLGYQAQVHIVDSLDCYLNISKTGCDSAHLNESFIYSIIGFKDNGSGKPDSSTAKILTSATLHGNDTAYISVTSLIDDYDYVYVVESTQAIDTNENQWTWDYNDAKVNGKTMLSLHDFTSISDEDLNDYVQPIAPNSVVEFQIENTYNENKLHYNSNYCANILSSNNPTKVETYNNEDTNIVS